MRVIKCAQQHMDDRRWWTVIRCGDRLYKDHCGPAFMASFRYTVTSSVNTHGFDGDERLSVAVTSWIWDRALVSAEVLGINPMRKGQIKVYTTVKHRADTVQDTHCYPTPYHSQTEVVDHILRIRAMNGCGGCYILSGGAGTGKTTVSRILAEALEHSLVEGYSLTRSGIAFRALYGIPLTSSTCTSSASSDGEVKCKGTWNAMLDSWQHIKSLDVIMTTNEPLSCLDEMDRTSFDC